MAPIDFSRFAPPPPPSSVTDPIKLFQSLQVRDTAINDLWLAQGDTLRAWHESRDAKDVAIVLNTGAGKTLVGLLMAQSLVNEATRHVVYACSSIQLVEQTAEKARGYGMSATTYFRGTFSNDEYQRGLAPCITTYQALCNGKSRFDRDDLDAVILDDAHAADNILRDQFTLSISRKKLSSTYESLVKLFLPYMTRVSKDMQYQETIRENSPRPHFVPPFAVREQFGEIRRLLSEAELDTLDTQFSWAHLKDHLDVCTFLVSGRAVTITPLSIPIAQLSAFRSHVRRVYLSATLAAPDAFVRTFGREPDKLISPTTSAGECERLILAPSSVSADDIASSKAVALNKKTLVVVPSRGRGKLWDDLPGLPQSDDVTEQVSHFKNASPPAGLKLVARYDGVDLPGDTCRLMIIDDLPSGLNPLEKHLAEGLRLTKVFRSTIASRIVQSFGRISRGMSDHGVVL
jgi:Rad3-related DNA helicase